MRETKQTNKVAQKKKGKHSRQPAEIISKDEGQMVSRPGFAKIPTQKEI